MTAAQTMAKTLRDLAHRHSLHKVFSDFVEMSAICLSNAVDLRQRDKRETRYMEIVGQYKKEEVNTFPMLLAQLVTGLENEGPNDVLGSLFHELELHNNYKGQFFTPYHLACMMAEMTFTDNAKDIIEERGYITASEPACGAGAMIIGLAETMQKRGINYQQWLHVTAVDLDPQCVHMSYVQFSLLHIPAVVVHGNTLSMEEFGHWYTPAHIMGLWDYRLRKNTTIQKMAEVARAPPVKTVEELKPLPSTKIAQLTLF